MNRGGTSAPLDGELGRLEVRVVFAIGKKRLIDQEHVIAVGRDLGDRHKVYNLSFEFPRFYSTNLVNRVEKRVEISLVHYCT